MSSGGLKGFGSVDGTVSQGKHTIRFVTGNPGKLREVQEHLAPHGWVVVQADARYPEIQANSLEEVAAAGAQHLLEQGLEPPFLLEDAGLFVTALRGFPGVYSRHAQDTIGNAGILQLMLPVEEELRTAAFEACLTYVDEDRTIHHFTGRCVGRIVSNARGAGGFGFDPIFAPHGSALTFAEMDGAAKSAVSHRGKAVAAFLAGVVQSAKR